MSKGSLILDGSEQSNERNAESVLNELIDLVDKETKRSAKSGKEEEPMKEEKDKIDERKVEVYQKEEKVEAPEDRDRGLELIRRENQEPKVIEEGEQRRRRYIRNLVPVQPIARYIYRRVEHPQNNGFIPRVHYLPDDFSFFEEVEREERGGPARPA